ncbi:MAG TPA: class I SAM-dependent methyltransferase [Acidimicrobiales bacterium]|nr:class I SAM-dependent methyltransferase [Acidimicrobiales bacterium]
MPSPSRCTGRIRADANVLELAAGTGNLTTELVGLETVSHVTALDSSPETLAIAATKLANPAKVSFIAADLFAWTPQQRYDVVAFGFWLSHVSPGRLDAFWRRHTALAPGGRVFFVDNAVPVEVESPTS